METQYSAYAKVTVQLEINVRYLWGNGCSIEQVYKQAADEADGVVRQLTTHAKIRSLGIVKIESVVTEKAVR